MGDPFTFESRATQDNAGQSTTGTPDDVTLYQPRALEAGEIIGHYRIEAPLGQGGNGTAYAARNIDDEDERVAIKLIRPDRRDRARLARLLRAEAAALRRVKHEAIVQYRTFKRIPESDEYYLVTEHIDGPTLSACMRDRKLSVDETRKLAIRVSDALETAHEQGVIHRDLSPDNIILPDRDPARATLIDFGIAKQGAVDPFGVDFVGKLAFAAPEQFEGDPTRIGPWTDLYSLGLTLAAAARGQRLDMGRDMESAIEARQRVPDLSEIPEELRRPISRLLATNPEARMRSAAAAAALFMPAVNEETIVASAMARPAAPTMTVTNPPGVAARAGSRWPIVFAVSIAALLIAALAGVWFMRASQTSEAPGPVAQATPAAPPPSPAPEKAKTLNAQVSIAATGGRSAAMMARLAAAQAETAMKGADDMVAQSLIVAGRADEAAQRAREMAATACNHPAEGLACTRLPDGSLQAGEQSCSSGSCVWNGYVSFSTSVAVFDGKMEYGRFKLGKLMGEDGSIFSGAFQGNTPNGLGKLTERDSTIRTGMFVNGALKGLGRVDFPAGDTTGRIRFSGSFRAGLKDGPGVFQWTDGQKISGIYTQDTLTGYAIEQTNTEHKEARFQDWFAVMGVSRYSDGKRYEGYYGSRTAPNDDLVEAREGLGVLFDADGRIDQQGIWRDDKLSEPMK